MTAEPVQQDAPRRTPDSPTDVPPRGWVATLKRTAKEFQEDNLTDWAAALTYYAVLALFPAMLVLVALLGLVGQYPQTTNSLLDIIGKLGPSSAVDTFRQPIEGVVKSKGGAGALLGLGLLGALWSASGYIGAFFRASNIVWDIGEGRPAWKLLPLRVIVTLVAVLAIALVLIGLVVTGPLAQAVGDVIGLGGTAVTVWNIAKWPVLLAIVVTIISVLYYIAPNVKHPKFSWVTPGGIAAVLVWIVASAGFAFYAAHFSSYNKTYGSLGAMIVFLVWLWITNLAILFGAELNAELERSRQMAEDPSAAEREPFMEPRWSPRADARRPHRLAMTEGTPQIRLSLPAIRASLPLIRQVIATLVAAQALPPRRQEQVLTAVATAADDAVRHTCRDAPPPREIVIEGRVRLGRLVITVIEDGPRIAPLFGTGDVPGGLALIGAFADRLELGPGVAGGSSTRMSFALPRW